MLKTKKVNEKIYDADYAILACKSINTNTPWIFSDSIRILKNNFVSVPLVQQPNTQQQGARKQPRPSNITTQPQQQQPISSLHTATTPAVSSPQPTSNPPSIVTDSTVAAISSSKSTTSEAQVATASNKSTTGSVANVSNKSGQSSNNGSVSGKNNTILTVANSTPLTLDEPKQQVEAEQPAIQEEEETQQPVTPQEAKTEESSSTIQSTTNELLTSTTIPEQQEAPSMDPTDSVPTLPTTTEEQSITTESEAIITTDITTPVVAPTDSPTSPQEQLHETVEVQGDEWSSLAIQPPASTSTKKKKASKKKKKKASAEEDDEELTPKTF